jgi:hypothetical protein
MNGDATPSEGFRTSLAQQVASVTHTFTRWIEQIPGLEASTF